MIPDRKIVRSVTLLRRDSPSIVSFSCLSNNRTITQPYRCRVSGATGANDYAPILPGWNKN